MDSFFRRIARMPGPASWGGAHEIYCISLELRAILSAIAPFSARAQILPSTKHVNGHAAPADVPEASAPAHGANEHFSPNEA